MMEGQIETKIQEIGYEWTLGDEDHYLKKIEMLGHICWRNRYFIYYFF